MRIIKTEWTINKRIGQEEIIWQAKPNGVFYPFYSLKKPKVRAKPNKEKNKLKWLRLEKAKKKRNFTVIEKILKSEEVIAKKSAEVCGT